MSRTKGSVQWAHREWIPLAAVAAEHIARGKTRLQALQKAQMLLPKHRRVSLQSLKTKAAPGSKAFNAWLEKVKTMAPEEIAEHMPLVPPPIEAQPEEQITPRAPRQPKQPKAPRVPKPDELRTGIVRWSSFEWAKLWRRINELRENAEFAQLSLQKLIFMAQEIELPPERHRTTISLYGSGSEAARSGLQNGLNHQHLLASLTYIAGASTYAEAHPQAQPPETAQAPEAAQPSAAPQAPPSPEQTLLGASEALAAAFQPPPIGGNAHQMATWVGISMANAMVPIVEAMLVAHEATVLERVRAQAQEEHKSLAAEMSRLLIEGVDRMLGGQSPMPEFKPIAPQVEPEPISKRIKIDVVGFEHGAKEMLVANALNGKAQEVDLTFVHPDKANTYAPHRDRNVIILLSRIPHSLGNKIKASGVKPLYVKRNVGDVVRAITDLIKQRDISATAH